MKSSLARSIRQLRNNPLHTILGLDMLIIGLTLISHQHYFFWPPKWQMLLDVENNSVIGFLGLLIGLSLLLWAAGIFETVKTNQILLSMTAAYLTWLGLNELLHAFFAPLGTPRMYTAGFQDLVMVLLALHLAKIGPHDKK